MSQPITHDPDGPQVVRLDRRDREIQFGGNLGKGHLVVDFGDQHAPLRVRQLVKGKSDVGAKVTAKVVVTLKYVYAVVA